MVENDPQVILAGVVVGTQRECLSVTGRRLGHLISVLEEAAKVEKGKRVRRVALNRVLEAGLGFADLAQSKEREAEVVVGLTVSGFGGQDLAITCGGGLGSALFQMSVALLNERLGRNGARPLLRSGAKRGYCGSDAREDVTPVAGAGLANLPQRRIPGARRLIHLPAPMWDGTKWRRCPALPAHPPDVRPRCTP